MSDVEGMEPNLGFDDSRRLTGPNRWFDGTAVQLTPRGVAARNQAAHADWAARVQRIAVALGWPDPQPRAENRASEVTLAFAAPEALLFTATEVNEWAWERAAARAGEGGFDLAQDLGDEPEAVFAARAAAERRPALEALRAATPAGLPFLVDDEALSIGAGSGSSPIWPLEQLPSPDAVDWPRLHGIPTVLVSGSNGKTTTVRLIAAIAAAAGRVPGWCCTEGVFIAGRPLQAGDWSGPAGARAVLRDQQVQTAVLETARGGLLRRGLAVQRAEVAVVTNISPDHLGEYGVENADDLAEVKLVLAHAVQARGSLVLNADDPALMAAAQRLPHAARAQQLLFAMDHQAPALEGARSRGLGTCGVHAGALLLSWPGADGGLQAHALGDVQTMPLSVEGAARHNIQNAAAAALAAAALGLPLMAIRHTLQRFGARPEDNPGRLERWLHHGATVLIDYAHNPDGLAQLLRVAQALKPRRLGLLLGQAGNRDDAAITELAHTAAAFAPDCVMVKELPSMLRGRLPGSVPALLEQGLREAGLAPERLHLAGDEETAAQRLLAWGLTGDVLVLPIHTRAVRERLTATLRAPAQPGLDPMA